MSAATIVSPDLELSALAALSPPREPRRWTVAEYHRMAETHLLAPDERVELIAGEIITMSPMGSPHFFAINAIVQLLSNAVSPGQFVVSQCPIRLGNEMEPEPDLCIVRGALADFKTRLPLPQDILLVVEISDTTLAFDRARKAVVYAQASLPEYWIVNLPERRLEVYRAPSPESGYRDLAIYAEDGSVVPLALPNVNVSIADLLP